jgi:hypothetical protein
VIFLLALRTLFTHPVRSAVLALGFGLGVAVMAILLGVGQVVLEQARSPQLMGGGDVIVRGSAGEVTAARVLTVGIRTTPHLNEQVRVASPWDRVTLYADALPVRARGGIPSLERALGDPEVSNQPEWTDTAADARWAAPDPGDVLRAIDAFHPVPDVPARASSWAEWLYFNGRSTSARFYITFLVGPPAAHGRHAGVRLQLDRGHGVETFMSSAVIADLDAARAPDLTIGQSTVRLNGLRYRLGLDLVDARGRRATGGLEITASPGRLLPPIEIHGARGWRSGYVVPVMSGTLAGSLTIAGERIDFAGGTAYHDHNWGFWEGVTWQWGQVQHDDISLVYGRVFAPPDVADPDRIPGFIGALGRDGPIGYSTNVAITETNDAGGQPAVIEIRGRAREFDLALRFTVESAVANAMTGGPLRGAMEFLQLRGSYTARGHVGGRPVNFAAPGSAETFRGR